MRLSAGPRVVFALVIAGVAAVGTAPLAEAAPPLPGEFPRPHHGRPFAAAPCTGTGVHGVAPGGEGNVAGGLDSGVLTGDGNSACDYESAVGTGYFNLVQSASSSTANPSIIAGGYTNTIAGIESFIGAGAGNTLAAGSADASIDAGEYNSINAPFSSIVGGTQNVVNLAWQSFIGGGFTNSISSGTGAGELSGAYYATIGGGETNRILAVAADGAEYGTIAGGVRNSLTGQAAAIGGGTKNLANGVNATVPGGNGNIAQGAASFAAGNLAYARLPGTFVWSDDSSTGLLTSSAANQFLVRASGGVVFYSNPGATSGVMLAPGSGAWSVLSDRTQKRDVAAIDDAAILDKVAALPVTEWSYDAEGHVRHLGPMAQDFFAAFHVGEDRRHIATIDEEGVALAAIKALRERDAARASELASLRAQLRRRDSDLAALQREVAGLAARVRGGTAH